MDYVERYADKQADILERKIAGVYGQAAREVREKLLGFIHRYKGKAEQMKKDVADGKITEQQYKSWLQGQVFQGKQWKQKLDDITNVYMNADKKARQMVNGVDKTVFAEAANYTAYDIDKNVRGAVSFNLYDQKTVDRLLKDDPKMLPEWKINEEKDYIWNEKRVQNAVTQGIIQGESVYDIGKRLYKDLSASNAGKMDMFARTAITGAQNAGRVERMREAQDMGIKVKKRWLASRDNRVRDAHADLDGKEVDVDEPFHSVLGDIMYPGDPTADPANTYNCRCTLLYVYPKHQQQYLESFPSYKEWEKTQQKEPAELSKSNLERQADLQYIKASLGEIPKMYRGVIYESLDKADEKALEIIKKTAGNVHVDWVDSDPHGVSHYDEGTGSITIITKDSGGEDRTPEDIRRTFWHEYGHYVDDAGVSNSGYGRKSEYSDHFFKGIGAEIDGNHEWENATVEDVNRLLEKMGLRDRYECRYEEGSYCAAIFKDGVYYNPRMPDFETQNELQDCLNKWVKDFSGDISFEDYMAQHYGYPIRPDRDGYIETYFTPKRNLYREKELFKGAEEQYQKAMRKYYDELDLFQQTHDMDKIIDEWKGVQKTIDERKEALASATDTFDGGVLGSFSAFILWGGHRPDYLARNRMGLGEAVANVFGNNVTGNPVEREAMLNLCPSLFNLITGVIRK